MIKEYGSVTAVVVTSLRKFVTIVASFLLFPKPFHANYLTGATLIFLGIGFETWRNHSAEILSWLSGFGQKGKKGSSAAFALISPPPLPTPSEALVVQNEKSNV
jgi:hypothetical protein